jgi:hypothetical protein
MYSAAVIPHRAYRCHHALVQSSAANEFSNILSKRIPLRRTWTGRDTGRESMSGIMAGTPSCEALVQISTYTTYMQDSSALPLVPHSPILLLILRHLDPQWDRNTVQIPQRIRPRTIRQFAIPLVLDFSDLAIRARGDGDHRRNGLLHVDTLDDVARLHVHGDGVAGRGDGVGEALDFGEGLLETVLWF